MSVQILDPIFNWPVCLFIVELLWLFIYCGYKAYIRYKTYKYHCTCCGFSFHLLDTVPNPRAHRHTPLLFFSKSFMIFALMF